MMQYIFGIGITLQLALTVMPALSAEAQLPTPSSPIQTATQAPEPRSANFPQRSPANSAQRQPVQPNDQTPLLERDRLILSDT